MKVTGEVHEREANVIEWTLRDFFSLPAREGHCFYSPKFPLDGAEWYLCMYPNGEYTEESVGYIVIYLIRISYDSPIQRNLSLGVKTSKNEIVEDKRPIHNYKGASYRHMWPRFMKTHTLLERRSELVPSDHLTLVCRKKNYPSIDGTGETDFPTAKCAYCKETMDAGSLPSHVRKWCLESIKSPEYWEVVCGRQPAQSEGYSASAPQSQSYSGSPGDGSYGGSAPSGYGSQPPNSGVGSSAAPASADGAGAPSSTGASAIPPVGPPSHDPPVHGTAPPPGGYGGPPPGADYNRPPGRYDGSAAPDDPGPMPGGPGGDYGSPTGYGGPGGRDGFQVNNSGSSTSGALLTNKILEDFKQLFLNQQSCDVILRIQGREFQAHRSILIARSPVFASLFQNDTKEKATAVVDIEDCSSSIFSDFLRFLYCQELNRLSEENVSSLLAAADKFGVSDLRTKCLEFMKEKFNVHILDDTEAPHHSETESIQLAAA